MEGLLNIIFRGGRFHMLPQSCKFSHSHCLDHLLQVLLISNQRDQVHTFRNINLDYEVYHILEEEKFYRILNVQWVQLNEQQRRGGFGLHIIAASAASLTDPIGHFISRRTFLPLKMIHLIIPINISERMNLISLIAY